MTAKRPADAYAGRLMPTSDGEPVSGVETQVRLPAFASNDPRAPAHGKVDLCSDAAEDRHEP